MLDSRWIFCRTTQDPLVALVRIIFTMFRSSYKMTNKSYSLVFKVNLWYLEFLIIRYYFHNEVLYVQCHDPKTIVWLCFWYPILILPEWRCLVTDRSCQRRNRRLVPNDSIHHRPHSNHWRRIRGNSNPNYEQSIPVKQTNRIGTVTSDGWDLPSSMSSSREASSASS